MVKTVFASQDRKLVGTVGKATMRDAFKAMVAATYRMVGDTCPSSCKLLNNGCYAQKGKVLFHQKKAPADANDGAVLLEFIRGLTPKHKLRHNVSGDLFVGDEPDEAYITALVQGHSERPDVVGWGYTHGWKKLDATRLRLPNLVINASCDNLDDLRAAREAGWAQVIVLEKGEHRRRLKLADDVDVVVCPQQTSGGKIGCTDCGLCWRGDRKFAIGFLRH